MIKNKYALANTCHVTIYNKKEEPLLIIEDANYKLNNGSIVVDIDVEDKYKNELYEVLYN